MADEKEVSILLQMKDELTSGLNRVEQGVKQFGSTSNRSMGHARGFGSSLMSIKGALAGLGGLWVVQKGIEGVSSSLKMAAGQEVSLMKLGVILKSTAKAQEYFNWAMEEANKTPFENAEVFKAVEGMTPFAKTTEDMKKYVQMAEVLATMNEEEGLTGAVFAMKEALSGDFTSLAERFNLSRSTINKLKEGKDTAAEFYDVVKQAAATQGFTYKMVGEYAKTSTGLMSTAMGTSKNWVAEFGKGLGGELKPALQDIVDLMGENNAEMSELAFGSGKKAGAALLELQTDFEILGNVVRPVYDLLQDFNGLLGKFDKDMWDLLPLISPLSAPGLGFGKQYQDYRQNYVDRKTEIASIEDERISGTLSNRRAAAFDNYTLGQRMTMPFGTFVDPAKLQKAYQNPLKQPVVKPTVNINVNGVNKSTREIVNEMVPMLKRELAFGH